MTKITHGANARPKNDTIAQSGGGMPDDSSALIETSDEEIACVREKLGANDPREKKEGLEKQRERSKSGSA